MPAAASASLRSISSVVSDLTFTTSSTPWPARSPSTIAFASAASRAQCTCPPPPSPPLRTATQVLVEVREHVRLDRAPRLAQLLPVRHLRDDARALRADRVGRVRAGSCAAGRSRARRAAASGNAVVTRSPSTRGSRRGAARERRLPPRESPPPIWSRHEPSTAVQTSAPRRLDRIALVGEHRARRLGVLDRERAAEAAAFVRARRAPRARARARCAAGAAARRRPASRAASGRSGGRRRGPGTRRRRPRRRAGARAAPTARSTLSARSPGACSRTVADARRRRRDHGVVVAEDPLEALRRAARASSR